MLRAHSRRARCGGVMGLLAALAAACCACARGAAAVAMPRSQQLGVRSPVGYTDSQARARSPQPAQEHARASARAGGAWRLRACSPRRRAPQRMPLRPDPPTTAPPRPQEEWHGEVVHLSWRPRAFLYKNFLTDEECEHLKQKVGRGQGLQAGGVAAFVGRWSVGTRSMYQRMGSLLRFQHSLGARSCKSPWATPQRAPPLGQGPAAQEHCGGQ